MFVLVVSLLLFSVLEMSVAAQGTEMRVIPAEIVIGEANQPIPTEQIITVNVTVVNVNDLYAWQVKIYYDPEILLWRGAWYPRGHVFDGKLFQPVEPVNGSDTGGTYILYFATLMGDTPGFTGSGILCSINFTAKKAGVSQLIIDTTPPAPWSWLRDSNLDPIDFTAYDGKIIVIPEFQFPIVLLLLILPAIAIFASKKLRGKHFIKFQS